MAIGFPASVGNAVDSSRVRASFKSGHVSSQQLSTTGVAQTEVDAPISPGMSGGPTIDTQGNVLGVNSFKLNGETQAFNFITDTSDLHDWLVAHGVQLAAPKMAAAASSSGGPVNMQPFAPQATPSSGGSSALVWVLILVALLLAAAVVTLFLLRRSGRLSFAPRGATTAVPVPDVVVPAAAFALDTVALSSATVKCGSCSTDNDAGASFCSNCGQSLR
jgi:hypothetical protein